MVKVNLNFSAVEQAATEAFSDSCFLLHRQMIQTISEPGIFEGFDGDIVDTGTLRASQQPPEIQGETAIFRNTVEYALYVHEGYTRRNGVVVPGRPWMRRALEDMDFQGTFDKLLDAKLQ